jgi:predicted nucleic acid-binding protein
MFLVDTSAWILHLSGKDPFHLQDLVKPEEIAVCPPVYQEILQGIRAEKAYRTMKELLRACRMIDSPLPLIRLEEAADLYRTGRKTGTTIRSGVDCLIAASALAHNVTVLHRDRDYTRIALFSGLRQREI